ncbi:MAG: polyphosphate kinase 1 [Bacteroidales bacterium]|nr:polyphosphate kinase 1 [Bacteroidales bacterium]
MLDKFRPKEISWLSFNERVLQQANSTDVPLMERIKFLGIYSSNLDEFFRVRVATLKRLVKLGEHAKEIIGHEPAETLKLINEIVSKQSVYYDETRLSIRKELKNHNVELIDEKQLSAKQREYLMDFFNKELKNSLMPILLFDRKNVPDLVDDSIYLAIKITTKDDREKIVYSILQIPTEKFDRFIILPKDSGITQMIYLDDVVRLGLSDLYYFIEHEKIVSFAFKITKDAELDIEDDISSTYLETIDKSLKKRKKGNPVRVSYDKNMSKDILVYLTKLFKIGKVDAVLSGGRYHNTKDFLKFPNVLGKKFVYNKLPIICISDLEKKNNFFDVLKKKDILLHFPYHSFGYFIDFLKAASVDKYVESIKITLYRLSKSSDVIAALLNAARNGKEVTVVLEIQARFDEQANLQWSEILTDGGVKVIHGVHGLKVHSKLTLIKRNEKGKIVYYSAIGTGNYNESTAKLYTDFTLLTANENITHDVGRVFSFLKNNYKHYEYSTLLVSPFNTRKVIKKLITNEIKNAKHGKKAYIHIKINNIDDREIIDKLYEASQVGVEVILLVRGMFSLVTDLKGVSENIVARGIVDRYLEHSRFMIFANDGNPKIYITSADLMVRNIDRRVEVGAEILDPKIKKQLIDIFEIHLKDNTSARVLDNLLSNQLYTNSSKKVNAQLEVHKYLSNNQ